MKAKFRVNDGDPGSRVFYQYAFSKYEMISLLASHGFSVIDIHGYASWKGIKDEIPVFQRIYDIPKLGGAYRIFTQMMPYCDRYLGHMVGFICKKQR